MSFQEQGERQRGMKMGVRYVLRGSSPFLRL